MTQACSLTTTDRRYLSQGSMARLTATTKEVTPGQIMPPVDSSTR